MGQNQCCQVQKQVGSLNLSNKIHLQSDPKDTIVNSNEEIAKNIKNLTLPQDYSNIQQVTKPVLPLKVQQIRNQLIQPISQNQFDRGLYDPKFYLFKRSGKIYNGQWKNKKPHGIGTMYFPNGSFYQGDYVDGIPYGHGRLIMSQGNYYEGQIKFGRANGYGTYIKDDYQYKGGFIDDNRHGEGEEKTNLYYFKGIFQYGQKVSGTLKYAECIYQGEFNDDLFDGKGTLSTEEGVYRGNFKCGEQNGYGQFTWRDGSVYRGTYYKGDRQGDGQFYNSANSSVSKGFWTKGSINGQGQYQQAIGRVHKVLWNDGKISAIIQTTR